jgi:hypothetical protein
MGIRKYVAENINKRLSIILEAWEIVIDSGVMTGKICSLREYLQKDLQNDEHFYKKCGEYFCGKSIKCR